MLTQRSPDIAIGKGRRGRAHRPTRALLPVTHACGAGAQFQLPDRACNEPTVRSLGGGKYLPARSARPGDHRQAVPKIVPQHAFHSE